MSTDTDAPQLLFVIPPGLVRRPPPVDYRIPFAVPEAIEDAARRYLKASHHADVVYSGLILMDRDGDGYATAYERLWAMERATKAALDALEDALGCGSGTYPIDGLLVRNVTVPSGGCELRIEPASCPWPREEQDR